MLPTAWIPPTSGEKRKHTGCLETVGCLRHFSHRLVKIPGTSNVKKEGLFCLTGQGVTPHGREVMEVRTRSSWSHCIYSPKQREVNAAGQFTLPSLLSLEISISGKVLCGGSFHFHLPYLETSPTGMFRGFVPRGSRFCQVANKD